MTTETKTNIDALLDRLGVTMTAVFVPFSKAEKWDAETGKEPPETITHRCALFRDRNASAANRIWEGEYHQGIGHLPAPYNNVRVRTLDIDRGIKNLIEHGKTDGSGYAQCPRAKVSPPSLRDVMHSIITDADAIDYPTYEEWASNYGYDQDSRKGESIYRRCLETGLKLRAALGEDAMRELREAFQDY